MAAHVAKTVAAGSPRGQVQVAYSIGVAEPVSSWWKPSARKVSNVTLEEMIPATSISPDGDHQYLDLRRPIYQKTAAYGHFGRSEPEFTWENTNRVKDLRDDAGI